jgi:hypothetical protein
VQLGGKGLGARRRVHGQWPNGRPARRKQRRGKKEGEGADTWGPEWQRKKRGKGERVELGLGGRWASGLAHAGRKGRRGEGPTGEKEGVWAAGCCFLLLLFFFSFSFLHSNIQQKLFEFN